MISSVSRFLILAINLLSYLSVHASSVLNTRPDYLVSFSSSSISEVRPSSESLPCQGLLLSSGHVATAPACAKTIAEQVSMGGTVNLLDNSRQSIGHLSAINTDETAKGILSASLHRAVSPNSLFSVTGLAASGNEPRAYFLQQGESLTVGHATVRLGDIEVKHGVQFQPLHSDTNLPPGSPVISGEKVVCLADGAGACVGNTHKQATHISKRSARSKRESSGKATGCTFNGVSLGGVEVGTWTCSDCTACGCFGECSIKDGKAGKLQTSTCVCNSGGTCSGKTCTATAGAASLTAGVFSLLVVSVAAIAASF
ncbi:hypothetical protein [Endozoicomonas sp. ALC020]|uniref:hypothetical protein n=1 Tax=unclassified Endozoicomonas TaxID=2644528 RepID=UPI003BB19D6C